jgi:hypothetical protein
MDYIYHNFITLYANEKLSKIFLLESSRKLNDYERYYTVKASSSGSFTTRIVLLWCCMSLRTMDSVLGLHMKACFYNKK